MAERRGLEGSQAGLIATASRRPRVPARLMSGSRLSMSLAFLGGLRGLGVALRSARFRRARVAATTRVVGLCLALASPQEESRPPRPLRHPLPTISGPTVANVRDAVASADDLWTGGWSSRVTRRPACPAIRPGPRTPSTTATGNSSTTASGSSGTCSRRGGSPANALPRPGPRTRPRLGYATTRVARALRLRVERPLDGDPHLRTCLRRGRRPEGQPGFARPCGPMRRRWRTPGSTSVTAITR